MKAKGFMLDVSQYLLLLLHVSPTLCEPELLVALSQLGLSSLSEESGLG